MRVSGRSALPALGNGVWVFFFNSGQVRDLRAVLKQLVNAPRVYFCGGLDRPGRADEIALLHVHELVQLVYQLEVPGVLRCYFFSRSQFETLRQKIV